jgi:hypothetical protein
LKLRVEIEEMRENKKSKGEKRRKQRVTPRPTAEGRSCNFSESLTKAKMDK